MANSRKYDVDYKDQIQITCTLVFTDMIWSWCSFSFNLWVNAKHNLPYHSLISNMFETLTFENRQYQIHFVANG